MLPDMIKTAFNSSVKQVVNVRTIVSAMLESEVYQKNVNRNSQVACTIFHFSSDNFYSREVIFKFKET